MHYRDEYFQFLPYHHDECKLSLNVPVQSTGPYAIQNTRNAISDALTTVMTEGVLKQLKALKHTRAQFALFLFSADNRSLFNVPANLTGRMSRQWAWCPERLTRK